MWKTEGFLICDSQNAATTGDIGRLRPQSVVRRKLADISNLPQNQRLLIQEEKSQSIETTTKEYINQLQKENMALVKMLAQRNKIIEQSGTELDRMRVNLLKMHEQNQQLALSNTQMLAELNSGKDRLKVLQHELGCKSGLLKARKLELEEKVRTRTCKNADAELIKFREEGESSKEGKDDETPQNTKRSLQSNSEPFVRRQSARFKAAELNPAGDLFETDDTKVPACLLPYGPVPEKGSTSESAFVKDEDNKCSSCLRYKSQEFGRSSLCRPSRLAAKKVQSYKEIPINIKMRRPE
ncbi:hypothetical protein Pfo_015584 [Paulownia fortunei]|nr:hypothetical protein Pfo_015584 [Paulownia fortunei]